jgi:hypothetical protein
VLVLGVAPLSRELGALRWVVEIGEAGVVELQVAAAQRRDAAYLVGVRVGEVGPELVLVRVDRRIDGRRTTAVVPSLGDGIVSLAVSVGASSATTDCRCRRWSPKIGPAMPILPSTFRAAEVKSRSPAALRKCTRIASDVRLTPRSR